MASLVIRTALRENIREFRSSHKEQNIRQSIGDQSRYVDVASRNSFVRAQCGCSGKDPLGRKQVSDALTSVTLSDYYLCPKTDPWASLP
jgi:hypothetical protein